MTVTFPMCPAPCQAQSIILFNPPNNPMRQVL